MKDGKYSVMIVEDQQMPKALFSHFVESSDKFYLQVAIENASVADIVCTRTPVDLILMDVVTENGESGLEAAAKIKAKFPKTKIIVVTSMPECSYIKRAKQIGVEGFWYKEVNEQPILSLMERVMNGPAPYDGRIQQYGNFRKTRRFFGRCQKPRCGYAVQNGFPFPHATCRKSKRIGACDTRQNRRRNLTDNAIKYIETGSRLRRLFFLQKFFLKSIKNLPKGCRMALPNRIPPMIKYICKMKNQEYCTQRRKDMK